MIKINLLLNKIITNLIKINVYKYKINVTIF